MNFCQTESITVKLFEILYRKYIVNVILMTILFFVDYSDVDLFELQSK